MFLKVSSWKKVMRFGKKSQGLGIKRFKGKKLNPNPFSLVFGLGKTPNVDKGVFYWL